MTRLIFEGIKIKADDPWKEDINGKEFYLDLNAFTGVIDNKYSENTENAIRSNKLVIGMDLSWNNPPDLKDSLLAAALSILDRQAECNEKPKGRTSELLSEMTGVSVSYCRAYLKEKRPRKYTVQQYKENDDIQKSWKTVQKSMHTLLDHIDDYEWCETIESLSEERKEAEQIIAMLEKKIIEGDEKMKKMTVDYLLEDSQCEYLGRIQKHFPYISEEDIFMIIMTEGSAMDITNRLKNFCKNHEIETENKYHA